MLAAIPGWQQVSNGVLVEAPQNNTIIRFYFQAIENSAKSIEAGHPVFEDIEHIEIRNPGEKHNIVQREITPSDKRNYAQQYNHWKATQENPLVGTPLREWPAITTGQVETLLASGIRTVEELSGISDDIGSRLGVGVRALRQKAKDWLIQAKDNSALGQMRAELDTRDAQISALQAQVNQLIELAKQKGHTAEDIEAGLEVPEPKKPKSKK